jgi:hypothetical protein
MKELGVEIYAGRNFYRALPNSLLHKGIRPLLMRKPVPNLSPSYLLK